MRDELIAGLSNADAAIRQRCARVLGLVGEVEALPAIEARAGVESSSFVRQALQWAQERLLAAQAAGHSSLEAIFESFRLNAELASMEDPDAARIIQQMEDQMERQMQQEQNAANIRRTVTGAAMGALVGGATGAAAGAMAAMSIGASRAEKRPETGTKRLSPIIPDTINVDVWLRRLRGAQDSHNASNYAREIERFNNPDAIFPMADIYFEQSDPALQAAIVPSIQKLYLSNLYFILNRDGVIDAEFDRRVAQKFSKTGNALPAGSEGSTPDTASASTAPAAFGTAPAAFGTAPAAPAEQRRLQSMMQRAQAARRGRHRPDTT